MTSKQAELIQLAASALSSEDTLENRYIHYNAFLKSIMTPDAQPTFRTPTGIAFATHIMNRMKLFEEYPDTPKYFRDTIQEFRTLYFTESKA